VTGGGAAVVVVAAGGDVVVVEAEVGVDVELQAGMTTRSATAPAAIAPAARG
jgi:hypothetical protein